MSRRARNQFTLKFSGWWFVVYLVAEWLAFGFMGNLLGWQTFLTLFLFKTLLGVYLLQKSTGFNRNEMFEAAEGFFQTRQLIQSSLMIVSGLLLIIPGMLTDFVGLVLVAFTAVRFLISKVTGGRIKPAGKNSNQAEFQEGDSGEKFDPASFNATGRVIDVTFDESKNNSPKDK